VAFLGAPAQAPNPAMEHCRAAPEACDARWRAVGTEDAAEGCEAPQASSRPRDSAGDDTPLARRADCGHKPAQRSLAMAETAVPVRQNVGAALRFVRENIGFIAMVSAIGAALTAVISLLGLQAPQLSLLTGLASGVAQAFIYAAFVGACLFGAGAVRSRWAADGGRVWAAMAIIGFFLFIVFFVLSIPVMIVLFSGPLAPYLSELQDAGSDQAAVMQVMTRFAQENPGALLVTTLFYAAVWFYLTSRLYLAAPATVDQQRILSFETWKWTRGSTLRIIGARLMLLLPANIFVGAIGYLVGRLFGIDTMSPAASVETVAANPIGFTVYAFVATFVTLALYSAMEAGLSTYLYRGLKPAAVSAPPA
jgi:hypothetical protein